MPWVSVRLSPAARSSGAAWQEPRPLCRGHFTPARPKARKRPGAGAGDPSALQVSSAKNALLSIIFLHKFRPPASARHHVPTRLWLADAGSLPQRLCRPCAGRLACPHAARTATGLHSVLWMTEVQVKSACHTPVARTRAAILPLESNFSATQSGRLQQASPTGLPNGPPFSRLTH